MKVTAVIVSVSDGLLLSSRESSESSGMYTEVKDAHT